MRSIRPRQKIDLWATSAVAAVLGGLALICCSAPALIGVISTAAFAAWPSHSGYFLPAAALIAVASGFLWPRHRRLRVRMRFLIETSNKASKHE